jgi:hypothetical protein
MFTIVALYGEQQFVWLFGITNKMLIVIFIAVSSQIDVAQGITQMIVKMPYAITLDNTAILKFNYCSTEQPA